MEGKIGIYVQMIQKINGETNEQILKDARYLYEIGCADTIEEALATILDSEKERVG